MSNQNIWYIFRLVRHTSLTINYLVNIDIVLSIGLTNKYHNFSSRANLNSCKSRDLSPLVRSCRKKNKNPAIFFCLNFQLKFKNSIFNLLWTHLICFDFFLQNQYLYKSLDFNNCFHKN